MPARLYLDAPLSEGAALTLPPDVSRHVQVLRLQPGDEVTLFNGLGGEWQATVTRMGRQDVDVQVGGHTAVDRELTRAVVLAVGMPANERMDTLVEKAAELGVSAIQPLHCARAVLKLSGERAEKRRAHWQGVATAACEQSGRTCVPVIAPIRTLEQWLSGLGAVEPGQQRQVLSFAPGATGPRELLTSATHFTLLSGPEGGLTAQEEAAALAMGFAPLSLGPRVLRADTAPLAALTLIGALPTLA
jgi:16S rRNA (uracil1498-N3)-methyltransferase